MKIGNNILNTLKKTSDQKVLVQQVEISTIDEMAKCINHISITNPEAIVMILAVDINTNSMMIATTPSTTPSTTSSTTTNWIKDSIAEVVFLDTSVSEKNNVYELKYPINGEHFAFKLVDQVRSKAFKVLENLGLYKVESDNEKEYNFDDI